MKKKNIYACFLLIIAFFIEPAAGQKTIVIRPLETDEVLVNPGIGFTSFQMFKGDHFPFHDVLNEVSLDQFGKNNHASMNGLPATSIAYFRIQWSVIEPEPAKYRWDFIDGLIDIAQRQRQTLMLRISPWKGEPELDVPLWFREMVGPLRKFATEKWVINPEDPRYSEYFGDMIRAFGKRYDGHPTIEAVDVSIVGNAGEGGGTELLTDKTMQDLTDAYTESFHKTPLLTLIHGKKHVSYLRSHSDAPVGWRQDCLGDLGFWAKEQNGWTHMFDYYPQTIIEYGMEEAWLEGPVSFEICGFFDTWDREQKYSDKQVQYIIDQSLKWHISSFNAKSASYPEKWKPLIDEWLKKMGYRFVLRKFSYPSVIRKNSKLSFETWWENKGVAPCYKNYELAIRIKNGQHSETFRTDANIKKWLPGDNIFNSSVFPQGLPEGEYDLQLALIDKNTYEPKISLAIEGRLPDGWYQMGRISIQDK